MQKKKLMHVAQSAGGVKNYISMLLKNMDRSKYEQVLVCSLDYDYNDFADLVDCFEYVDMIREISIWKDICCLIKLRRIIKKYKPDVIYLHSSKAGALGRLANIGIRNTVLYNPHGWPFNMHCSSGKQTLYRLVEKALALLTDHIVVISDAEKKSALINGICRQSKMRVVYNGIDIDEYNNLSKSFLLTRSLLGIPEEAYVIGAVGRLSKQKAPDTFVKAAALIKKEIPSAYFILVGDGEDRKQIEKIIKENNLDNCLLITGWVKNSYEYINLFDQALLLSRWEGFGLALAEYMISRKPIIATRVDAIPDIISDGENGLLVEVDNIDHICNTVVKLYHDEALKKELVENGYRTVCGRFDIKRVAKEHDLLIND
ncbi:MAG TPA: glycosyltransferase family 4 protein [Bacillota bacterium]|jgi:glycosyltransferase involved in cell wall biosynthesis|nr:glycosyltransferase family 4 protein [Bacillota bacterium]HOL08869.1 glycosyltransferase family 4 protein [Bacillota bacterium]HPO96562.1 glycosyltransferase family 4 protein [Bacillota bacterium]